MLERDFQKQVIKFLKEHNIYYIKIWGGGYQRSRNTRFNIVFKRKIRSSRTKDRYTVNHQHCNYIT